MGIPVFFEGEYCSDVIMLEAGSSLDDVVRVHYILPDRLDFESCWPVFKKYLGKARPAATMFVAGLVDERMKLEIEVTARFRDSV